MTSERIQNNVLFVATVSGILKKIIDREDDKRNEKRKEENMANNYYGYQYDTNPRKIAPDYKKTKPKKSTNNKKKAIKSNNTKTSINSQKKREAQQQKRTNFKLKFAISLKTILIFAALFFILFREAQINEKFSKIQNLKSEVTTIQKENDQLEIGIQNSLNLNNIEQAAKEILGMQKLTKKQTVYIALPKKDYVEHRTEEVILEQEKNWFDIFMENLTGKK